MAGERETIGDQQAAMGLAGGGVKPKSKGFEVVIDSRFEGSGHGAQKNYIVAVASEQKARNAHGAKNN